MHLDGKEQCFIGGVLDISRKATVAQVGTALVSRCFARRLVQDRMHFSSGCCGLRDNASDVRSQSVVQIAFFYCDPSHSPKHQPTV